MQSYVYDVIRAEVPKVKLDDLFTMKDQLSEKVKSEVSGSMHPYGSINRVSRLVSFQAFLKYSLVAF